MTPALPPLDRQFIVIQEPKRKYRAGLHPILAVMRASNATQAKLKFIELAGHDPDSYTAPHAEVLTEGEIYRA